MNVRLWFISESESGLARRYSRLPSSRSPSEKDKLWMPRELWPEHHMTVADWLAEKENL